MVMPQETLDCLRRQDAAERQLSYRPANIRGRVAPTAIRTGVTANGFEQDDDGVTLHLASGESVSGDILIGADSVHSAIRQQMFGVSPARFTGLTAWRGSEASDPLVSPIDQD
jgi:salicylate hydroxylase